jgi:hypothetical protein
LRKAEINYVQRFSCYESLTRSEEFSFGASFVYHWSMLRDHTALFKVFRCTRGFYGFREMPFSIPRKYSDFRAVGSHDELFAGEVCEIIGEISGRTPRTIDIICDTALFDGFAAGANKITPELVEAVIQGKAQFGVLPFGLPTTSIRGELQIVIICNQAISEISVPK